MRPPQGVAPPDLIRQDFRVLDARETLRTTWTNEQLILIQSVQGHAHEGHGVFRGRRFPNTTLDDVTRALRLDPGAITGARQALIDSVADYADRVMQGTPAPALLDRDSDPLLGISTLRLLTVDPSDVLRGLFLGGLRDDAEVRQEVERERGVRIGSGRCYFVDFSRMRERGLDADELARGEWLNEIDRLRQDGVIVDPERAGDADVAYQYVRHVKGPGASDDAAIVAAGMRWGLGVAVGVFLADAIDTLEKYVPAYGDQDADLALRIQQQYPALGLDRRDVHLLTFLALGVDSAGASLPDSSLRHLLAVDRHADLCPLEAHLCAVQSIPAPSIGLGHERFPSARFYSLIRERVSESM